jgi:hypothetical protein
MDMKSLIAKMDQLEQVDEETKKKPDKDGDGVPDWADKKDGEDDHEDKEKVDETSEKILSKMKGNDLMKHRRDAKADAKKEKEDKKVDEAYSDYEPHRAGRYIEEFVDEHLRRYKVDMSKDEQAL